MGLGRLDAAGWLLLAVSPLVGSFLGVVIRRLPHREPIAWSRSRCPHCHAVLAAGDLVPLASWLMARGHCRHCGAALGWFYPGVEVACLAIAVLSLAVDGSRFGWLDGLLGCWLLALAWIDAETWLLPDALTLPLIVAGVAAMLLLEPQQWPDRALGIGCGYFGFRAVAWAYRRLRGREGLGGGDAKLLAAAGAWVGAGGLPSVIFAGALAALLTAAVLMLAGRRVQRDTALPFGPFLALAIWLVWLFGPVQFGAV